MNRLLMHTLRMRGNQTRTVIIYNLSNVIERYIERSDLKVLYIFVSKKYYSHVYYVRKIDIKVLPFYNKQIHSSK
jgi:hypothetical protein